MAGHACAQRTARTRKLVLGSQGWRRAMRRVAVCCAAIQRSTIDGVCAGPGDHSMVFLGVSYPECASLKVTGAQGKIMHSFVHVIMDL